MCVWLVNANSHPTPPPMIWYPGSGESGLSQLDHQAGCARAEESDDRGGHRYENVAERDGCELKTIA